MFTVLLTNAEKRIIRRIAKIQIASISTIVTGDCPEDLELHCIVEQISRDELVENAMLNLQKFEWIKDKPSALFELDEDNLNICKHILVRYFNNPKYNIGKRRMWKKFILLENIAYVDFYTRKDYLEHLN